MGLLQGNPTYDDVLATTVAPTGELRLVSVGWARPSDGGPTIAVLGDRLVLRDATVAPEGRDRLNVTLTLEPTGPIIPDDVLFIHVLDAAASLAAGADDDLWGGYLPLDAIPAAMLVGDVRTVNLPALVPGDYAATVGLYNRATGARYDVTRPDGTTAWNGELQIDTLRRD